jgi:hypothetical protein
MLPGCGLTKLVYTSRMLMKKSSSRNKKRRGERDGILLLRVDDLLLRAEPRHQVRLNLLIDKVEYDFSCESKELTRGKHNVSGRSTEKDISSPRFATRQERKSPGAQ